MIQFNDAFIKFFQTFDEAKLALFAKDRENVSVPDIVLNPFSYVCQQTYGDLDIVLTNYKAEIIDCYGKVLKDITSNFGIYSFIDNNGVNQIVFEIAPIRKSFYSDTVFVKLSSTIGSEVYYSTPFYIMDWQENRQFTIDYFSYSDPTEFTKRIGFYGKQNPYLDKTETKTNITTQGLNYSETPIISISKTFKVDMSSELQYIALVYALKSDIVYINGVRVTNKPTVNRGDFIGDTNRFECEFEVFFNQDETFNYTFQLVEPFRATSFSPFGVISVNYNQGAKITFNKEIQVLGDVFGTVYDYDTDEVANSFIEFGVFGSNFIIDEIFFSDFEVGKKYYILFPLGQIQSIDGEPFEITDKDTWTFTVLAPDYDINDYSNDYLI